MSSKTVEIVREFGKAWERRDIEAIIDALADNIVYQNVPIPAMYGKDEVRHFITPNLTKASGVQFDYLHIVASPDDKTVLCERMDKFFFGDHEVPIPVMGVFEFEGNKICAWRDYSDIATFIKHMHGIGQMPGPGIVEASS